MSKVFFIAEAGKNFIDNDWKLVVPRMEFGHYLDNAKKLADIAKKAEANAVKFQVHNFEDEYELRDGSRWKWIEFNFKIYDKTAFWDKLKEYCDKIGIELMITSMSKFAAIQVENLISRWKVGSASVTDYNLLEYIANRNKKVKKPVILSTGMSTQKQVETALDILKDCDVSLLYCKSIYPCPMEKIDFKVMENMKMFGKEVGFSDHTVEVTTPMLAALNGASIIEKHFTLDKNALGSPDHKFSLDPNELKFAVKLVREYEQLDSLTAVIRPSEEEVKLWKVFRKYE